MSRRLLAINALLVVISLVSVGVIVKHLATSHTVSAPRSRPAAGATAPGPTTEEPRPPAQAYNVIASRNLFNPTRSESAVAATPGGPALNIVKPNLHGVVLRDGSPIAYLEDPQTKRIAGYRIGDPIAGGTVQTISADAVVIARPDGMVDVRLRDPSKPRPQPTAAPPQPVPGPQSVPGAQAPVPGPLPMQGSIPPRAFVPPPTQAAPGMQPQPAPPGATPEPPVVAVTPEPPPTPAPEARPPLPPVSVGPRPETPPAPREELQIAPSPAPPTAPPVPAAQRGRFVVLNFDNADVETVIQAASEIIGFNYVLAPDVRGKVTVQTSGRIAQEEVFGVLLAILEVHGFTAVKSGNLYKIIRIEGARERAVPTIVGPTPDPNRTTDEIITQIVAIKYSSVNDLSALLRPLISTRGTLIAHRETNVLIITDTASNITRLLDIIRLVDVQVAQEELQIIPVTYADSAELATILTQLFASGRIRTTAPGTPPAPTVAPQPPGAQLPGPGGQAGGSAERVPLIIPERRSNSLIVHAKKHEVETIRRLVSQLDVNIYGGRRVFIYYAENAKSKDLATTLNSIYGAREGASGGGPGGAAPSTPGRPPTPPPTTPPPPPPGGTGTGELLAEGQVRFISDEITNAVIVTTFPRSWAEIENTIKQLDRMPRQVLIEVLVAEVTLTEDTRLGIDWAVRNGRFNVANINTGSPALPTSAPVPDPGLVTLPRGVAGPAALIGPFGQGLTAFTFATDQFIAMLNALASENK